MPMQDILGTPGGALRERGYAGQGDMNPAISVSRINESADVNGLGGQRPIMRRLPGSVAVGASRPASVPLPAVVASAALRP